MSRLIRRTPGSSSTEDDRFLLAHGHETNELERIVEQTDRYVIVDKVADAEAFVQDDPRGAPSR